MALLFVSLVALAILFLYSRTIAQVMEEVADRFRGGPRTPMHPSPSNDALLLSRRMRRKRNQTQC